MLVLHMSMTQNDVINALNDWPFPMAISPFLNTSTEKTLKRFLFQLFFFPLAGGGEECGAIGFSLELIVSVDI